MNKNIYTEQQKDVVDSLESPLMILFNLYVC